MGYKRDVRIFCGILGLYAALAGAKSAGLLPFTVFPVFAWDLFTKVPLERMVEYRLYLDEIDGKTQTPPVNLQRVMKPFKVQDPANFFALPVQLKDALDAGDQVEFERISGLMRARYFPTASSLKFTIMRASYDPIARWRDPNNVELTPVHSFQYAKGGKP